VKLPRKHQSSGSIQSGPQKSNEAAVATTNLVQIERRVLRLPEVMHRVGLSRSTIWRLVRRSEFPIPIPLSTNAQGWFEDEVSAWLTERASSRITRKHGEPRR
jgi:prophage regulatory protein